MDLPQSYLDQPRWWSGDGNDWLAALPAFVAAQSERWRLTADGEFTHGSHALIVPVVRDGERLVLRLSPPDDDVESHVRALRFWAGHGTVQLVEADVGRGAMLLERLGPSLTQVPSEEAVAVLGRVMRRLGVPAPADVPATSDIVRERAAALESEWLRLDAPFERKILDEALAAAVNLAGSDTDLAVNGDLHSGQIRAVPGSRGSLSIPYSCAVTSRTTSGASCGPGWTTCATMPRSSSTSTSPLTRPVSIGTTPATGSSSVRSTTGSGDKLSA